MEGWRDGGMGGRREARPGESRRGEASRGGPSSKTVPSLIRLGTVFAWRVPFPHRVLHHGLCGSRHRLRFKFAPMAPGADEHPPEAAPCLRRCNEWARRLLLPSHRYGKGPLSPFCGFKWVGAPRDANSLGFCRGCRGGVGAV